MIFKEKILFSKEECQSIIWKQTEYITKWNKNDRKYDSEPIHYSEDTKWLFDKLTDFMEWETDLNIKNLKKIIHFHKFIKGDWFEKHNDSKNNRLYLVGVMLNNNFKGGDFKLYNPNECTLNKEVGNSYIFDVRIEHEITPILEGERYSLLWFLENEHIKIERNKLI